MSRILDALLAELEAIDWSASGPAEELRGAECFLPPNAPGGNGHRAIRAELDEIEWRLPAASRLVTLAAEFATATGASWAGPALEGRAARYAALTAPDGRADRARLAALEMVESAFDPPVTDRWYEIDDRLWPVFDDRRVGAAEVPDDLTCWLILRRMLGTPEALRLRLPAAVWWLTLHAARFGAHPGLNQCRCELRNLCAEAVGDEAYGCWLLTACRDARSGADRAYPDLAASLCRTPSRYHAHVLAAARTLAERGRCEGPPLQAPAPPPRRGAEPVQPARRGRPPLAGGPRRDQLIAVSYRSGQFPSYSAAAEELGREYPLDEFSADIVRNAVRGRRDQGHGRNAAGEGSQ